MDRQIIDLPGSLQFKPRTCDPTCFIWPIVPPLPLTHCVFAPLLLVPATILCIYVILKVLEGIYFRVETKTHFMPLLHLSICISKRYISPALPYSPPFPDPSLFPFPNRPSFQIPFFLPYNALQRFASLRRRVYIVAYDYASVCVSVCCERSRADAQGGNKR